MLGHLRGGTVEQVLAGCTFIDLGCFIQVTQVCGQESSLEIVPVISKLCNAILSFSWAAEYPKFS